LAFGYATGAVSIVSDGFHSLTDSASNIIGLIGARAASKPPDEDHPYGHRKYETLAAGGIFVFLVLVVVEVLRGALERLYGNAPPPQIGLSSFVVMGVTLAVNLLVVRYESGRGRALKSELLLADAMHTRSDVLTSCAVLVSLAGVWLGYPLLDPIGGLIVAARPGYSRTGSCWMKTRSAGRSRASLASSAAIRSGPADRSTTRSSICTSGSGATRRSTKRTGCRTSSRIG
jgi:cation diffusion facilitator family transporter